MVAAQFPVVFASSCSTQSATITFSETSFDEQLSGELQQQRVALKKKKLAAAKKFLLMSVQVYRLLERFGLRTSFHEVLEGEERQEHLETSGTLKADSGVQVNSADGDKSVALFTEQLSMEKGKKFIVAATRPLVTWLCSREVRNLCKCFINCSLYH